MTQKFTTGALLIAVASALTWLRAQEIVVPDTSTLVRMAARFAPTDIGGFFEGPPAIGACSQS